MVPTDQKTTIAAWKALFLLRKGPKALAYIKVGLPGGPYLLVGDKRWAADIVRTSQHFSVHRHKKNREAVWKETNENTLGFIWVIQYYFKT